MKPTVILHRIEADSAGVLRQYSERGATAGLEGLMFGVMILLGGVVLIVNAWSVIDTRTALDSASREYLRTYSEQSDVTSARLHGERAAFNVLAGRKSRFADLDLDVVEPNGFGPCSLVTVTFSTQVPTIRAPFLGAFGSMRISSTASELVDSHREMTPDARYSAALTDCFDE